MTADDHTPVDTFVDEAQSFTRHHSELDTQQQAFGGVAYGMMRALFECPTCPGHFRVALDPKWERLYCDTCGGLWIWQEPAAPTTPIEKPKRTRKVQR